MSDREKSQTSCVHQPALNVTAGIRWNKTVPVQRLTELLVRLMRMPAGEIRQRIAIQSRKVPVIRKKYVRTYEMRTAECAQSFLANLGVSARSKTIENFRNGFFIDPADKNRLAELFKSRFPGNVHNVVSQADELLNGGVDILGTTIRIGPAAVDWKADPVSGRSEWPDDCIDEATAIGVESSDVKHVWEINRHQYLTTLGRAYWFTGDVRFRNAIVDTVSNWIDANPPGRGVNWASHLEVAVRVISWLWTLPFIVADEDIESAVVNRWLGSIANHYYHLSRNLSTYTDPTNHLIGEAAGLFMLCCCFPQLPNSKQNLGTAVETLTQALANQVHDDGVNKEQATSYHRFVLDFYLQIVILAGKRGIQLDEESLNSISRMLDYVAALCGKYGMAPMIGDSDDARGVPFIELTGWDFRDLLSSGALLFRRGAWKNLSNGPAEISVWLLGAEAYTDFEQLSSRSEDGVTRVFPSGGYCFLDSQFEHGDAELIFDCGNLGLLPNAAHGHADALSIQVRVNGSHLLCDSGTGSYFSSRDVRNYFRQTRSHNTVEIGGCSQSDIFGPFKWVNPASGKLLGASLSGDMSCAVAKHDGYMRLRGGGEHRRTIASIASFGWLVIDRVDCDRSQAVSRHFHFPPSCRVSKVGDRQVTAVDTGKDIGLRLTVFESDVDGDEQLEVDDTALWSDRYGTSQQTSAMTCTTRGREYLLTLIEPLFALSGQVAQRFSVEGLRGRATLYRILRSTDSPGEIGLLINPEQTQLTVCGGLTTNAEAIIVVTSAAGTVKNVVIQGGQCTARGENFTVTCEPGDEIAAFDSKSFGQDA